MTESTEHDTKTAAALTWDWPHRLWHWAFAAALCVSLYSGLADDLELMDLHMATGACVIGLMLFRFGWACWGGRYVRFSQYRTSPAAIWRHFARHDVAGTVHSAPGAAMAIAMWTVVLVQVASGPFSSDDIFTEGPFAHYLSDSGVDLATRIHTLVYWLIVALIVTHLLALAWYAWRRDPVAVSMWTGRGGGGLPPIQGHLPVRAISTAAAAAALVWAGSRWL
jgi:cytochrome b